MHLFNKILLALIFLTGAFYFVLVSNRFSLGKSWEEKIAKQEREIQSNVVAVDKLKAEIYGVPLKSGESWEWKKMGLIARNKKLDTLIPTKMWTNCEPRQNTGLNEEGKTKITLSFSVGKANAARVYDGRNISDKNLFFVFDSGVPYKAPSEDEKHGASANTDSDTAESVQEARFLGTFVVTEIDAAEGIYQIESDGEIDAEQKMRILDSINENRSWIVYEDRLPIDSPNDIAAWIKEYPDDPYVKFSDADKQELSKGGVTFTESDTAADGNQGGEEKTAGYDSLPPESDEQRYSVPYQAILPREDYKTDRLTILVFRAQNSKKNLNRVICDQLAMIGCDGVPLFLGDIAGVSEQMRVAYQAISDNEKGETPEEGGLAEIQQGFAQSKAAFDSVTFIEQERSAKNRLASMESQRDIVKKRLDIAEKSLGQIEVRINDLIRENSALAKDIADAEFKASDQILQKAGNIAALAEPVDRLKPIIP